MTEVHAFLLVEMILEEPVEDCYSSLFGSCIYTFLGDRA